MPPLLDESYTPEVRVRNVSTDHPRQCFVVICCSVPQGSVLGPRMFILYTADLEDAVAVHDVRLHAYADDTQLYLKCQAQEATTAAHTLEACITDVQCCNK